MNLKDLEPHHIAGCYEHGSRVYLKDDCVNKRFYRVFVVGATGCLPTQTEPTYALIGRDQPGVAFVVAPSCLLVPTPHYDIDGVVSIRKNGFDFAVKIKEVCPARDDLDWEYRAWGCHKWISETEIKKSMEVEVEVIEL